MAAELPTLDEVRAVVREEIERALRGAAENEAVSVAEAARRLGLSSRTVQRRIKDGTLPVVRVGSAVRIPMSAVFPRAE